MYVLQVLLCPEGLRVVRVTPFLNFSEELNAQLLLKKLISMTVFQILIDTIFGVFIDQNRVK